MDKEEQVVFHFSAASLSYFPTIIHATVLCSFILSKYVWAVRAVTIHMTSVCPLVLKVVNRKQLLFPP